MTADTSTRLGGVFAGLSCRMRYSGYSAGDRKATNRGYAAFWRSRLKKFCRKKGIEFARRLLGHANISATQKYMHLYGWELEEAQDLVE